MLISEEGGPELDGLMVVMAMLLTVVLVLASGIGLSYMAATGILRAFGHRPQQQPAVALTAVESISGD